MLGWKTVALDEGCVILVPFDQRANRVGLVESLRVSLRAALRGYGSSNCRRRLNKRFSKLKGRYIQCDLAGQPLVNQFTDVTEVRRNLLVVEGDDPMQGKW